MSTGSRSDERNRQRRPASCTAAPSPASRSYGELPELLCDVAREYRAGAPDPGASAATHREYGAQRDLRPNVSYSRDVGATESMFQMLWDKASQHARVMYDDPRPGIFERGGFETRADTGNRPLIVICEDSDRKVPNKPCWECGNGKVLSDTERLRDLITLAHEYGHLVSFLNGTRTSKYEAALGRLERREPRLDGDADLIVGEETLAWTHGRATLRNLGFTQWKEFDARESAGIDLYRRSLT